MYQPDETHRAYHNLRADLIELHGWAETALNGEHDRQYIAEHMTSVMWALLTGETPPSAPFPAVEQPHTYTHPDVLTIGGRAGWADAEIDPTRIDWTARRAAAAIPFDLLDGRPVNPCESTGIRYGRNELGHWGEQLCADALVTFTDRSGRRWALMVERSDGHGWALPGGYVEPGEAPDVAAVRELAEETGLTLPDISGLQVESPRYVPDPRASDEAWMVTVLTRIDLGTLTEFPAVTGADDAERAAWVRAENFEVLAADLDAVHDGEVFPAHRAMLADTLGHIAA